MARREFPSASSIRLAQPGPTTFLRKDNTQQPPIEGGYVFKGYRLVGEERIPAFRYTFQGLDIVDTPTPHSTDELLDAGFVRTFTLSGSPVENLYFRAAVADDIEANGNNTFLIGDQQIMQIVESGNRAVVRESGGKKELLVPVVFANGKATIKQLISWQ